MINKMINKILNSNKNLILFTIFAIATCILFMVNYIGGLLVYAIFSYLLIKTVYEYEDPDAPLIGHIFKSLVGVSIVILVHVLFYSYFEPPYHIGHVMGIFIFFVIFVAIGILLLSFFFVNFWAPKIIFGKNGFTGLYGMTPEEKLNMEVEDNKKELEKIELYTIDNLGRKYQALGMVESTGASKEDAKLALQLQAFRLEADAIVKMTLSTSSTTSGDIHADTLLTPGGGGSIHSSVMYHYEGTAVKYLDI